jgi:hypothetical protein
MANSAELKNLSLGELFSAMSGKNSGTTESNDAFREYHRRYHDRLGNLCEVLVCKRRLTTGGLALEVFRRTLVEVYLKAASFKAVNMATPDEIDQLLMGWMAQIAAVVLDELMKEEDQYRKINVAVPEFYDYVEEAVLYGREEREEEDETTEEEHDELYYEKLKAQVKKLNAAMKKLNHAERLILKEYFSLKGVQKYLDKERIAYLCRHLKLTQDNILHIKKRALEKLEKELKRDEESQDRLPGKSAIKKSGSRKRA